MTIGGKEIKEIIVTTKSGNLVATINDKETMFCNMDYAVVFVEDIEQFVSRTINAALHNDARSLSLIRDIYVAEHKI